MNQIQNCRVVPVATLSPHSHGSRPVPRYASFLASHGGSSNAFTDSEDTSFFFDVAHEHLREVGGYLQLVVLAWSQCNIAYRS